MMRPNAFRNMRVGLFVVLKNTWCEHPQKNWSLSIVNMLISELNFLYHNFKNQCKPARISFGPSLCQQLQLYPFKIAVRRGGTHSGVYCIAVKTKGFLFGFQGRSKGTAKIWMNKVPKKAETGQFREQKLRVRWRVDDEWWTHLILKGRLIAPFFCLEVFFLFRS